MGRKRKAALPDYIGNIRKPLAPPTKVIPCGKDYDRDKAKAIPDE